MAVTTHIFDLRRLVKPMFGKPIAAGRQPRPHYETNDRVKAKREAARKRGAIDRVLVHHWGVEVSVHDDLTFSDAAEAWLLACRAAGLELDGRSKTVGGTPYHVSVGATSRGSGVVALVWPRDEHTFHAGTQNARSIGVGVMGRFERDEEGPARPGLPEAMAWAFHIAAGLVRDPLDHLGVYLDSVTTEPVPAVRGADAWLLSELPLPAGLPPVLCTTHSQSANKPHDPGLYVVRHGIAPAVRAGLLTVEPTWHTGGGQGWPRWWADALLAPLPRPE